MVQLKNIRLEGKHDKPIMVDVYYKADGKAKPVIIFAHGFKGFKDWGHFDLLAQAMVNKGFVYVKFNFSHNGTTPSHPTEFADLEAFGNNTSSIELDDLGVVIDFISSYPHEIAEGEMSPKELYLMGHSRGGGITLLKANEDDRVKKVVTLASVSQFGKYWSQDVLDQWKKEGVIYIPNSRTNQQMPMYYTYCEDYLTNKERLDIPVAVKNLKIPALIAHGTDDPAVPYQSALDIHSWNPDMELFTIEGGNHVFGGRHPYEADTLPEDTLLIVEKAAEFLIRP